MKILKSFMVVVFGLWSQITFANVLCTAALPGEDGTVFLERIQNIEGGVPSRYILSVSNPKDPEKLLTLSDEVLSFKTAGSMPLKVYPMPSDAKTYPAFVSEIQKHGDGPLPATVTVILAEDLRLDYGIFQGQMIINDPGIAQSPITLTCTRVH